MVNNGDITKIEFAGGEIIVRTSSITLTPDSILSGEIPSHVAMMCMTLNSASVSVGIAAHRAAKIVEQFLLSQIALDTFAKFGLEFFTTSIPVQELEAELKKINDSAAKRLASLILLSSMEGIGTDAIKLASTVELLGGNYET